MLSFKNFLLENTKKEYNVDGEDALPGWFSNAKVLHDFLFHLSSPVDPDGHEASELKQSLTEATVFDIKRGDTPGNFHPGLPKTNLMLRKAQEEGLGHGDENIHKRIGHGFRRAYDEMASEHPTETRRRLAESKRVFQEFAQARGLKAGTPPKILRGNMKTEKSSGVGFLTTGINLAPHSLAGLGRFDVCPSATDSCRTNCLGTTAGGNKQYPDTALSSKVLRTHFLAAHPEHFARILDSEIEAHKRKARREGAEAGIRLNVTSDIKWEQHVPQMFEKHKDVQFYDYTKSANRVLKSLDPNSGHPENYHLTLSHTGTVESHHAHGTPHESNDASVSKVLAAGGVVASVVQRGKDVPEVKGYHDVQRGVTYPVANGDDDDNTFDRHETVGRQHGTPGNGVISLLKLKGVKNEAAGAFASRVPEDGIVKFNHPITTKKK